MIKKRQERKQQHKDLLEKFVYRAFVLELPPTGTRLGMALHGKDMVLLKEVTPNSPIHHQIPAEFQNNCRIASLKSDVIGCVQPKTVQECIEAIMKAQAGPEMPGKLEIDLIPANDTPLPTIE